jgi:hypothetical protein
MHSPTVGFAAFKDSADACRRGLVVCFNSKMLALITLNWPLFAIG